MTLNLIQVSAQISDMAAGLQARRRGLWRSLELARALFVEWSEPQDLPLLQEIAGNASADRLIGEPVEPLGLSQATAPPPPDYTVVGTDGSQIDLDRHSLAPCYLINVGSAAIAYGGQPAASLTSRAQLYYTDDDLFLKEGDARVAVQGSLLDLRRTLAEQESAREFVQVWQEGPARKGPLLVIMDGTLVLWRFSGREGQRARPILKEYLAGLRTFQRAGVPVCSYVSRPAARDVIRLLVATAEAYGGGQPAGESAGTTEGIRARGQAARVSPKEIEGMTELHDRLLFEHLPVGARSGLYASQAPADDETGLDITSSGDADRSGDEQRIHFFYINVGQEVGRVEVPAWVAKDTGLLGQVHALVVEQCRLGWGYPVVLSEAHEQAVIRGSEREAFLRMVGRALNDQGLAASLSAKRLSKNRRAV